MGYEVGGSQEPGTKSEGAPKSGLFGARPQAASECTKEIVLAGPGKFSQTLLLLLEVGVGGKRNRFGECQPPARHPGRPASPFLMNVRNTQTSTPGSQDPSP